MRRRAFKLSLWLPLLLTFGGCDGGRGIYYALTHRIVRVPTENMLPTIKPGDHAAVNAGYYNGHPIQRFDMVTFELPAENRPAEMENELEDKTIFLKRIIGLGGETLEIKDGRVYIDGSVLEEPFKTIPLPPTEKFGPVQIPAGEFFLLGDNRQNSFDGRYWTRPTLGRQHILGKVVEIFPQ